MKDPKQQLTIWLNEAYSMEKSIIKVLENHAKDAEKMPNLHALINSHIEVTRNQAERIKQCVENLGGSISETKTFIAQTMGKIMEIPKGSMDDEVVKNALMDYTTEHYEIACYTSLVAAAELCEQREIADVINSIREQEIDMANRLASMIPDITVEYLNK